MEILLTSEYGTDTSETKPVKTLTGWPHFLTGKHRSAGGIWLRLRRIRSTRRSLDTTCFCVRMSTERMTRFSIGENRRQWNIMPRSLKRKHCLMSCWRMIVDIVTWGFCTARILWYKRNWRNTVCFDFFGICFVNHLKSFFRSLDGLDFNRVYLLEYLMGKNTSELR